MIKFEKYISTVIQSEWRQCSYGTWEILGMVEFSYENSSPLKLLENMEGPVRCGKDLCICQSL